MQNFQVLKQAMLATATLFQKTELYCTVFYVVIILKIYFYGLHMESLKQVVITNSMEQSPSREAYRS